MYSKIKNFIFKIDPETAHNLAIKSLKFNFVPNIFDINKKSPLFETNLFGKKIDNPIVWLQDLIRMQKFIIQCLI